MKKTLRIKYAVFFTAFIFSSIIAFGFQHTLEKDDESQYDVIARNIVAGNGFSISSAKPFTPTMIREPVYPYFLSGLYRVFGMNYPVVRFVQVILFCLTCLLVYRMAEDIFSQRVAAYAAFATAISPAMAGYVSYVLTETLFTFLMCLAIFCLTKAVLTGRTGWFAASGAVLGLTALCKSIALPFFIIALAGIALLWGRIPSSSRRKLIGAMLLIAAFFGVIAPWSYRNSRTFGTAQISLRGGNALWDIAEKISDPLSDIKKEAAFNFSEYLGDKLFPGTVERPQDFILSGSKKSHDYEIKLLKEGFTPLDIDRIMKKEAIEKIRANPVKFIVHIPVEFIKMTAFVYMPELNKTNVISYFNKMENGRIVLSFIRGLLRILAYPILIFAVIGMVATRKMWYRWFFIVAVIFYINLAYSMLFAMGRYAVPLIPFYMIFASAGFIETIGKKKAAV